MKRKICIALIFLLAISYLIVFPPESVNAEPKKIVVPDDYPTISAAVGNATDGDTIFVRNGTYSEPALQINKSITLTGESENNTIVIFHPNDYTYVYNFYGFFPFVFAYWGNIINVTAENVTLSGLTIKSDEDSQGIVLPSDGTQMVNTTVETAISGSGNRIQLINNTFTDGIRLSGCNLTIAQNSVGELIDCEGVFNIVAANNIGTVVKGSDDNPFYPRFLISTGSNSIVIDNNITTGSVGGLLFNGNSSIAAYNYFTTGVWVNGSQSTVCENRVANGGMIVTGNNNTFYENNILGYNVTSRVYNGSLKTYNYFTYQSAPYAISLGTSYALILEGASAINAVNNTFYRNNFLGNTQVRLWDDASRPNFFDNGKQGNYWSTNNSTDQNKNNIADTPYTLQVFNRNYEQMNEFQSLTNTSIQDLHPLMAPFNQTARIKLPEWATSTVAAFIPQNILYEATSEQSNNQKLSYVVIIVALCVVIAAFSVSLIYMRKRHNQKLF